MGIHWQELVIVLIIALVVFGPRRLPEIGRSLGSSVREFKDSFSGVTNVASEIEGKAVAPKDGEPAAVAVPVESTASTLPTER